MSKTAIVIGSGIAGLASAIRLAAAGCKVSLFEANDYPGGKISTTGGNAYRFDAGPSLFTLPNLVDELFQLAGRVPQEHFRYHRKEVACRYFWEDGTDLTAWADREKFALEAEKKTGIKREKLIQYLQEAATAFDSTYPVFLEKSLHQLTNYLSKSTLHAMLVIHKLNLLSTLNQVNEKRLGNPKMVQLFNRFATYNGSSPYLTPGVMRIIPHLEHNLGTYYPEGGMHAITLSLQLLAEEMGVNLYFNSRVERILVTDKVALGVEVNGVRKEADLIFSNMDVVPTYRKLLPDQPAPEKTLTQPRSSSALIFYWGISRQFDQLDLHNIFFSDNYRAEFEQIFNAGGVYEDPTVYVNISAKEDPADAPAGAENWFVMVNVPPNTGQDWDQLIASTRERVLVKLGRMLAVDLEPLIDYEEVLDPRLIESRTSSYQGALYGASSNNPMAALLRHPNFTRRIKNLYFCGGSVHPGGGIPLSLLSARIATEIALDKK